ncbi:MAG: hypothetical protein ACKO34_06540 [Vampirovibrionales bacterium]
MLNSCQPPLRKPTVLPILLDFDETLASKTQGGLILPAPELDCFNQLCQTLQTNYKITPQLVISTGRNAKAIANVIKKLPVDDDQRKAFQGLMLTAIATQNGSLCVQKPVDMDNLQFLIQVSELEQAYNVWVPLTTDLFHDSSLSPEQKMQLVESANHYLQFVQQALQATAKWHPISSIPPWNPTTIGQKLQQGLRDHGFSEYPGNSAVALQLQARRGAKDTVPVEAVFLKPVTNPTANNASPLHEAVVFFQGQPLSPQLTWMLPHQANEGQTLEAEQALTLPQATLQQSIAGVEALFETQLKRLFGTVVPSPKLNHKNEPSKSDPSVAHLFHDGHWNRAYYELNPFGEAGKGQVLHYWVNLQHSLNTILPCVVTGGDSANDYSALACLGVTLENGASFVPNLAFLVDRNNDKLTPLKIRIPTLEQVAPACLGWLQSLPRLEIIGDGSSKASFGTPAQLVTHLNAFLRRWMT